MKNSLKLVLSLSGIICVCLAIGINSFGCQWCQHLDNKVFATSNSVYSTTDGPYEHHTVVDSSPNWSYDNSRGIPYGLPYSETNSIPHNGLYAVHYELGKQEDCYCTEVFNSANGYNNPI